MKRFFFLFFILSVSVSAQQLKLIKATKQSINPGAEPSSINDTHFSTNYIILLKKEKPFIWSVDSVVDVYTQRSIKFHIVKIENRDAVSPNYVPVKNFSKKDKGVYQITFSVTTFHKKEQPETPMNKKVPVNDLTQGVLIFYSVKKKEKQLPIESFEELETLNAP